MFRTTFTEEIMDTMMGAILNTHTYTHSQTQTETNTHAQKHSHILTWKHTNRQTHTRISNDQVNQLLILNSKLTRSRVRKA